MVSIAQGLRMMGGGKDTSGYADMLDSMEVRDLLGERREAAALDEQQQALMDFWGSMDDDTGTTGDTGDTGDVSDLVDQSTQYSFGDVFNKDFYTGADEKNIMTAGPDAIKYASNFLVGNPDTSAGGEDFKKYVKENPGKSAYEFGKWAAYGTPLAPTALTADLMGMAGVDPYEAITTPNITLDEVLDDTSTFGKDSTLNETGSLDRARILQELDENMDIDVEDYPDWYREDDHFGSIAGEYLNKADGGRVGMFLGGTTASGTAQPQTQLGHQAQQQLLQPYSGGLGGALVGLINQNPQIQQQLQALNQQNYNLPTQIQNQMYTPPQAQQAWSPYVNAGPAAGSMGFYDPSTLDMPTSNDPVMLGGPDPYQMVDPYATLPIDPYSQGPRPLDQYGIGLSQADIAATFADMDKFSLEAQRRKAEAAAAAAKAAQRNQYREHQGGGGGNPNAGNPSSSSSSMGGHQSHGPEAGGHHAGIGDGFGGPHQ